MRHDHVVDVAALGRNERREETVLVFLGARRDLLFIPDIGTKDDLHRPLRSHHGNLRGRPGIIDVAADMLGRHHVIGAAERLTRDNGDQRNRALTVGKQEFRPMLDQRAVLLVRAGQ